MCKNEGKHLELNGAQWEQILMNLIDKSVNGINSHLRRNLASISNCIHKLSLKFCRESLMHRSSVQSLPWPTTLLCSNRSFSKTVRGPASQRLTNVRRGLSVFYRHTIVRLNQIWVWCHKVVLRSLCKESAYFVSLITYFLLL